MAKPNEVHAKTRKLLESIASELNAAGIGEFRVRTSDYDRKQLPKGFDSGMDYIARKSENGKEEIVLGINGEIIVGLDKKKQIRAYFFDFEAHQAAKKYIGEYAKREGIDKVHTEEFYRGKF